MTIQEGNKILAVFMCTDQKLDQKSFWMNIPGKELRHWINDRDLKYNTSWDWLMPVIEKISQHRYTNYLQEPKHLSYAHPVTFGMIDEEGKWMFRFKSFFLYSGDTLIDAAWLSCVEWITMFKPEEIIYDPIKK